MLKCAQVGPPYQNFPVPPLATSMYVNLVSSLFTQGEGMGVKVALIPSLTLQSLSRELAQAPLIFHLL